VGPGSDVTGVFAKYSGSDRPVLIRDRNGTIVSVAAPPGADPLEVEAMREELERLEGVGKAKADSKRGGFKIVEHGMQLGAGIKVCCLVSSVVACALSEPDPWT